MQFCGCIETAGCGRFRAGVIEYSIGVNWPHSYFMDGVRS